jgi:hypothetical protein
MVYRGLMMSDQELRDRMLQRLYDVRHVQELVMLPNGLNMSDVDEQVLGNILGQLKDKGWVKWHRMAGGLCRGAAKITPRGVEEMERRNAPAIPPLAGH